MSNLPQFPVCDENGNKIPQRVITIRLSLDEYLAAKEVAAKTDHSLNQFCRRAIQNYIQRISIIPFNEGQQ
jgi:hypothetical protein